MTWPFETIPTRLQENWQSEVCRLIREEIFSDCDDHINNCSFVWYIFTVFAEQRKMLSDLRGQYQTVVMETTQKEIEHLSTQPEIEQWGLSKDFGSARYQDSTLAVEYADKGWMKLGKRPSYVGNFPEKEQEIIVEQVLFRLFWIATGNRTDNSFEFRQRRSGLYHFWYFAKGK